jgi:CRISPR-associated endonuclease/helicase Cas3
MITELLSHPGKLLLIHSKEVAAVAMENIKGKNLNFTLDVPGQSLPLDEVLSDVVYLSAAFHDLGKATQFFQQYIRNTEAPHDKRKSHALLSAVFVFFVVENYLQSRSLENELVRFCSVFAFSAVKRHHGKLNNLSDEILIDSEWRELLPELAKSIDSQLVQQFIDELLKGYDFLMDWTQFLQFVENEVYDEILDNFSFNVLQSNLKKLRSNTRLSLYYLPIRMK